MAWPAILAHPGTIAAGQFLAQSAFNLWQNDKQQDFQRNMSNTAHQRQVADLRAAGINPMLSAKLGGASTPTGSAARADGPDIAQAINSAKAVNSTIQLQAAQANQANSAAALSQAQAKAVTGTLPGQIQKIDTEIKDILQSTNLKASQVSEIETRVKQYEAQIRNLNAQTQTEQVKLAKEKAISTLFKGLEDALDASDKPARSVLKKIRDIIFRNYITPGGTPIWESPSSAKELEGR